MALWAHCRARHGLVINIGLVQTSAPLRRSPSLALSRISWASRARIRRCLGCPCSWSRLGSACSLPPSLRKTRPAAPSALCSLRWRALARGSGVAVTAGRESGTQRALREDLPNASTRVPCLAVPCRAVPCRALPCRAVPCPALPCRAVPCRAVPCLAVPCRAMPCRAVPCCAVPCRALPCPCRALPCLALPCLAGLA
jgi:hypothetical protein